MMTAQFFPFDPSFASAAELLDLTDAEIEIGKMAGLSGWWRPDVAYLPGSFRWLDRIYDNTMVPVRDGVLPTIIKADPEFNNQTTMVFGSTNTTVGAMRDTLRLPVNESFTIITVAQPDPINTTAFIPIWGDVRGTNYGTYIDYANTNIVRWSMNPNPLEAGVTSTRLINSAVAQPRVKTLMIASFNRAITGNNTARLRFVRNGEAAVEYANTLVPNNVYNSDPNLHIGHCGLPTSTSLVNMNGKVATVMVFKGRALLEAGNETDLNTILGELQTRYGIIPTA